ncbi:hypothetical protein GRI43_04210 [Altererythrobacter luteolus]|uniref:Tetratricopeptide repeat protein n=1 Tax=Pontixanthobacter luteolus TaxID=295089 RepID=A0A6I4UXF4_9SPHN|nr:hypothetical protein [Pontixanthobacter luteolus]MXP46599.1 hypothetical protein [Pontixanthobacter luteolus]
MFAIARTKPSRRTGSSLALAIALASGTALGLVAFEAPAHAAKKKKKESAPKANYSKNFVKVYQTVNELLTGENADPVAAKAAVPGMLEQIETDDDKRLAGSVLFNVGRENDDVAMQRRGFDMMIESGKVAATELPQYLVNSGEFARQAGDYDAARARFAQAIDAGYTGDLVSVVASTYFDNDQYAEGVKYLRQNIDKAAAAGKVPTEIWIDVGFSVAYNNDLVEDAIALSMQAIEYYPSDKNWANAFAVQRNTLDMSDDITLDLLRLAAAKGALSSDRDYSDYIQAADAIRLPGEVSRILNEAVSKGVLKTSDPFVAEAKSASESRLSADRAELPAYERDAKKPGAKPVAVNVAADLLYSYGEPAKAEEIYAIAATLPGLDSNRVMTRMGMAQVAQGKFAEAKETFAKVTGARAYVARLWSTYADTQMEAEPALDAAPEASS